MGVYQTDRLAGAEWVSVQRFWVSLLGELKPALRLLCLQSAFSDCVCIFRLIFGFVETAFRPALFQIIGQGRGGQNECQGCGCGGLLQFRKAASRLSVSPQVVTRVIAELEAALGEPLFVRSTRQVRLTDFGTRFLPRAAVLAGWREAFCHGAAKG